MRHQNFTNDNVHHEMVDKTSVIEIPTTTGNESRNHCCRGLTRKALIMYGARVMDEDGPIENNGTTTTYNRKEVSGTTMQTTGCVQDVV